MSKFQKKPVVIEASRWFQNGDHPLDKVGERVSDPFTEGGFYIRREGAVVRYFRNPEVSGESFHTQGTEACGRRYHEHGWIDTAEGGHIVCPGDWIITGIKGELYPCKPGIFEDSYTPVEQPSLAPSQQTSVQENEIRAREVGDQRILGASRR